MMMENSLIKRDGSPVVVYQEDHVWSYYDWVDTDLEVENCNLLDEMANGNPMVKFFSMLVAVVITLLGICAVLICWSYCQLQAVYTNLEKNV